MAAIALVAILRLQVRTARAARGAPWRAGPGPQPCGRSAASRAGNANSPSPSLPRISPWPFAPPLPARARAQGWLEAPRRIVVAVDGGVFLKYYNWRVFLDDYLRESLGEREVRGGKSWRGAGGLYGGWGLTGSLLNAASRRPTHPDLTPLT
jgi:hypothetical protein